MTYMMEEYCFAFSQFCGSLHRVPELAKCVAIISNGKQSYPQGLLLGFAPMLGSASLGA